MNKLEVCETQRLPSPTSEAAVEATPDDHPDQAGLLNYLEINLGRRYARTGNLQDLEAAIVQSKLSLKATPEGHTNQTIILNNLGNRLSSRYDWAGDLRDLEAAQRQQLSRRYKRAGNLHDLEAAIVHLKAAVEATPGDHPDRATQQAAIHRRNKIAQDLDDILQQIRQERGFKNFLRAESEEYLLSAAQWPIIVLIVTKLRSDSILVNVAKTPVTTLALPHLSHDSMIKHFGKRDTIDDNEVMRKLLEWLWKAAIV
ncbi:hypothetical protein EV426DRAFT_709805 [Tirmania nivea]|nr:hypothetical protein EV426DRAFT_709805 [Tirmania nivea]